MNLYLLKGNLDYAPLNQWDTYRGFVIAAPTLELARVIAAKNPGAEGPKAWLDARNSTCLPIAWDTIYDKPEIILSSFNAG